MNVQYIAAIIAAKLVRTVSNSFKLGSGGTWPGEIALRLHPNILSDLISQLKHGVILIAGTNGKTTTALMIKQILKKQGSTAIHNESGANLDNGIVSALVQNPRADWGIFEVDENILLRVIASLKNKKLHIVVVLLNLFRDQLDRYGEVDVIAEKWATALKILPPSTFLIVNADDPLVAHLGLHSHMNVTYFGITDTTQFLPKMEHATDSIFCLNCGARLVYEGIYFSHIGLWSCNKCGQKRPKPEVSAGQSPLPGLYNLYNTYAALSVAKNIGIHKAEKLLTGFAPAFGRQEEIMIDGKKIKIFLSKNPAGFNQSLRTILSLGAKHILFAVNDRIPDGRDVSWIWDVDFEMITASKLEYKIFVSGDRVYDLAVRLKYAGISTDHIKIFEHIESAVHEGIKALPTGQTMFVAPTYSAMLDIRKVVTGRKIL